MKKRFLPAVLLAALTLLSFTGCMMDDPGGGSDGRDYIDESDFSYGEKYNEIVENPFTDASFASTFSLDANTAAYGQMRSKLNAGRKVPKNSVRIEEYINYFDYDSYQAPAEDETFALNYSLFGCPWNAEHSLLRVGLRSEEVKLSDRRNNVVLLVDTSGSMQGANRIGLVKESYRMLADALGEGDKVSLVTYANSATVLLDGADGSDKARIVRAIDNLETGGGTAGSVGIERAYLAAQEHWIEGGNNRVLIATDGDFNIGVTEKNALVELIDEKRSSGIYLSVFGFGMGNTRDDLMEELAVHGDGGYGYIDTVNEARRLMVEKLDGTMVTVAKDAKISVKFDPELVLRYRLIGYEHNQITVEAFEDPDTDAGEIGAGLEVTALYELESAKALSGTVGSAELRYRLPEAGEAVNQVRTIEFAAEPAVPGRDDSFIACVAEFGLLLRESEYRGTASFESLAARAALLAENEQDPFRIEFFELLDLARRIYRV